MSQQLKFIASVFKMAMKELLNVMGPESVQTIFRLIGEGQGEAIERRLRLKYKIEKWTPEQFSEAFIKDVIEPALGENLAEASLTGDEIKIVIKVCPFKRANMKISDKLYCTYTEGMIDEAFKRAFQNIDFKTIESIADRKDTCSFKIKIKK
ncbi:MAG: methanogen output domain 1-containing protein [Candidatus Helarchaeota archaeon]